MSLSIVDDIAAFVADAIPPASVDRGSDPALADDVFASPYETIVSLALANQSLLAENARLRSHINDVAREVLDAHPLACISSAFS